MRLVKHPGPHFAVRQRFGKGRAAKLLWGNKNQP